MLKKRVIEVGMLVLFLILPMVSAGIGIKWDKESVVVSEGEKTCMIYNVYNPFPEETYATIELSEELKKVLVTQDVETKLIPGETSSKEAIPIQFCFKLPKVYKQDCSIGNFICKQECNEEQVMYEGEVLVKQVPDPSPVEGASGSSTSMSVSAPLRIRINCKSHSRDFSLLYITLAVIALIVIAIIVYRKFRKPEQERKKGKLDKPKEEMKKLKGKK